MPIISTTIKPTSLKLPAALKTQLENDAQSAGVSLHAFMVQTLADSVRRTRIDPVAGKATHLRARASPRLHQDAIHVALSVLESICMKRLRGTP